MKSATVKFQEWLTKARQKAGLTYVQLAERSGVSNGSIHGIEHGQGSPSLDTAEKLCKALGGDIEIRSKPKHCPKPKLTAATLYPDSATGYTPDSDC